MGKAFLLMSLLATACGRIGFGVHTADASSDDAGNDGAPDGAAAGMLGGSFATQTADVNLSSAGTADWSHWGLASAASFDHKATGGVVTLSATSALTQYVNNTYAFSWIGGAPTSTASNTNTGVYITQLMKSIAITTPADPSQRTLRVYTDVFLAAATVTATLSDGSAPGYSDATLIDMSGATNARAYSFVYAAGSPGQSLVVTLTLDAVMPNGNLAVPAATLTSP